MLKQLAVVALLAATPALAQTPPPAAPQTAPADAPTGRPMVTPEMKAAREAMRQACTPDVQNFCKDVQPGGRRIGECLRTNRDHLSPDCLAAWQKLRAVRGYTPRKGQ